jgi:hypothetical protein
MKRLTQICLATIVLSGTLALGQSTSSPSQTQESPKGTVTPSSAAAPAQNSTTTEPAEETSLGAYARSQRKDKAHAAKKYDNDNLPMNDSISVVGDKNADGTPAASADSQNAEAQTAANQDKPKVMPGQTQEQRQQVYDKWQEKINIQQQQVDSMAHELDLNQREYRLRAAAFYADAGNRLRNEADWDKEDADYKQKMADQQKALDEAKQKLNDLQEEARKSGVPESVRQTQADNQ